MTPKTKIIIAAIVVAAVLFFAAGWGIKTWQLNKFIKGADAREQKRNEQIAVLEADSNKLRSENDGLRKDNSALEVKALAQEQIITERGGSVAVEQKKLEAITEKEKEREAAINRPTSSCERCKSLSVEGVKAGIFDKPLDCREQCK